MAEAQLGLLRRHEDREQGFYEEFLDRRLGPQHALGILAGPLDGADRDLGWIVCPALGAEQGPLRRLEAMLARSLASSGSQVLRIRPDLGAGVIDLSAQLAAVDAAAEHMRSERGAESLGVVAAHSAALVAATSRQQHDFAAIVLIEPVARGKQYLRDARRRQGVLELMARPAGADSDSVVERGDAGGDGAALVIRGRTVSEHESERISDADLLESLRSFAGTALLVGISPPGTPHAPLLKLAEQLKLAGSDVTVDVIEHELAAPFDEHYFIGNPPARVDSRIDVDRRISDSVIGWAASVASAGRET